MKAPDTKTAIRWAGFAIAAMSLLIDQHLLPEPYATIVGKLVAALGAGLALWTKTWLDDVAISDLPADIQDSVRPPK